MVSQVGCDVCNRPTTSFRIYRNWRVCFNCRLPEVTETGAPMTKKVVFNGTETLVRHGDRFLWHSYKWFVVDFLNESDEIVVRMEGTSDVALLPDEVVAELVEEFNYSGMYWR